MLTPIQAIVSALLTAVIVQLITLQLNKLEANEAENNTLNEIITDISSHNPNTNFESISSIKNDAKFNRNEADSEVNKLIDAIFVTHGMEDKSSAETFESVESSESVKPSESSESEKPSESSGSTKPAESAESVEPVDESLEKPTQSPSPESSDSPQQEPPVHLHEDNFNSVYSGDWLILAYAPWHPESISFYNNFLSVSLPNATTLSLVVLDCQENPRLAALLNVRSYPSLHLVTNSGRLREWPFPLAPLNNHQASLRFLANADWKYLPVYQKLKANDKEDVNIFINQVQIQIFNYFMRYMVKLCNSYNLKFI